MTALPTSVLTEARRILGDADTNDDRAGNIAGPATRPVSLYPVESLAELAANPPPPARFLLRRYWPADAYGVIAAGSKAGKTWLALDIAVAVATGGVALGLIAVDRPGPVLVFLGEGGRRNAWRRLRAVCDAHDVNPADVDGLHLSYRSPRLNDVEALGAIAAAVETVAPVLIIVDPLYLAAAGSDGASLYGMAEVLGRAQALAENADAALIVSHHWNQSGKGSGFGRMSGAGPEEWGRVLWSVEVDRGESVHTDGSLSHLTVRVRGGEVADTAFTVTREVWADDPDDLNSVMHYELTAGAEVAGNARKVTAADRVLAVLRGEPDRWMTAVEVQDADAEWSHGQPGYSPLKLDTVSKRLGSASDAGTCLRRGGPAPVPFEYRASDGAT